MEAAIETQVKVDSSVFSDVEYDAETKTLTLEFKSGGKHRHEGVPPEVYEDFVNAASIGKAYHSMIRNQYPSTKL